MVGNILKTSITGIVEALGVDIISVKRVFNLLLTRSKRKEILTTMYVYSLQARILR